MSDKPEDWGHEDCEVCNAARAMKKTKPWGLCPHGDYPELCPGCGRDAEVESLKKQNADLTTSNARLREALERIFRRDYRGQRPIDIAREALEEKP